MELAHVGLPFEELEALAKDVIDIGINEINTPSSNKSYPLRVMEEWNKPITKLCVKYGLPDSFVVNRVGRTMFQTIFSRVSEQVSKNDLNKFLT